MRVYIGMYVLQSCIADQKFCENCSQALLALDCETSINLFYSGLEARPLLDF